MPLVRGLAVTKHYGQASFYENGAMV